MSENPVKGDIARAELGKPGPPIGRTRYSAIKQAMGIKGHYVFVSKMREWLMEHPDFTQSEIYPPPRHPVKKSQPRSPSGSQAGTKKGVAQTTPPQSSSRSRATTKLPRTRAEWQEAVDAAEGALCLDSARQYGLVTGGPEVNVVRVEFLLREGKRRGITPAPNAVERFAAACMAPARQQPQR